MPRSFLYATTALALATAAPACAQDLEPVADTVTEAANDLRGVAWAADGRIYVSGHLGDPEAETSTVVGRFNADGTPDTSFGEGGFATVDIAPGRVEQSFAVAALSGGDVVAAVNAVDADGGTSVYLLRLDDTGTPRADWGEGGALEVPFGWANARNDGFPGVEAPPADTAWDLLLRLDDTGTPRADWGEGGALEVPFGWANAANGGFPGVEAPPADTAWDLLLDTSGGEEKLVVAGFGAAPEGSGRTDSDRYLVRLLAADGTPDPAFNGGAPFSFHSAQTFDDGGRRASVEADGAIVSTGYTNLGDTLRNHVILIRLSPDGTLDAGFGGFVEPASSGEAVGLTPTPGVAIFNPFVADGGFAEGYAAAKLSDGSYVTTGYGAATAEGVASSFGFKTTEAQDVVTFKVAGTALDTGWGQDGRQAIQSEGTGRPTAEDRGRQALTLPGDRVLQVGRFGGIPAAFVLDATGQLDPSAGEDGIIELPNDTLDAQFFGAVLSPDGKHVALTTNNHKAGARLVILELEG